MHPLLRQVRTVAHQARRLVLQEAIARWLSFVLLTIVALGLADYFLRFREAPLRWLSFFAVVAVAVWRWRKSVGRVLANRCSDRQIAQWIERTHPDLRESLSSAVSFLQFPVKDSRFGSEVLRAEVVRRATAAVSKRNLMDVLDPQCARRAIVILFTVTALGGALCALDSDSAWLAMRRLAVPWIKEAWPRKNHLTFTNRPEVLAQGQDFDVEVEDEQGVLPDDVSLLFWFDGEDESAARAQRMTFAGGKMTYRLPAVTTPFQYRAVGGDDRDMDWTALRIVVPPKIVKSRIIVQPPAYTGRPAETAERRIRGLAGSTVRIDLWLDRPVAAAALHLRSPNQQLKIPAAVTTDGRLSLPEGKGQPWTLTTSGTYSWELTDLEGTTMTIEDNTEVDVVADSAPVVSIESPAVDAGFTTRALVPVRCLAKDDLAIQRIEFRAREATHTLAEFAAPQATTPGEKMEEHQQQSAEYSWDLSRLSDLTPGTSVSFEVVAADFRPQTGSPASGTIRILSDQEFQQRLDEGQSTLLRQLQDALRLQRTVRSQTSSLATQLQSTRKLTSEDSAVWPALDPGQRRVSAILSGDEGALRKTEQLLLDLSTNRWEAPELESHLSAISQELRRVTEQLVPPVQQRLSKADRLLRFEVPEIPLVIEAWSGAASGQEHIVAALELLVDRLGQWDRYRNLAQEVRQLLDDQAAIAQQIRESTTAGRDAAQLTPDERAGLERGARKLSDLATQVDRMQSRLNQLLQQLSQSNPSAAKSLREALEVLEREPVSGGLRESARSLSDNRLGAAARSLEDSRTGLQKLLAALEQSSEQDASQVEQLLAAALGGFATRQEAIISQTMAAGQQADIATPPANAARELAKAQTDLETDVADLARRMPEQSGYSLAVELAGRPMKQAGARLANGQFEQLTLKLEREALDLLTDLLATLAKDKHPGRKSPDAETTPSEADPSAERQPSLAELKLIRLVQLEILRRTGELESSRDAARQLSPAEELELQELATRQRQLAELLEQQGSPPAANPPSNGLPAEKVPANTPDPSSGAHSTRVHRDSASPALLVSWVQRDGAASGQNPPQTPRNQLDRALLEDQPPATKQQPGKSAVPAGEDLGQGSPEASPFTELGRQMRAIELRLSGRDTTDSTQQMQRRVAAKLTTLIEQLEQQRSEQEQKSQAQSPEKAQQQGPPESSAQARPEGRPGSGTAGTGTDKEGVSSWARGVWGVLPDRVRQQIQDLGDEQFLPEYEDLIRSYYDRLSERGRP